MPTKKQNLIDLLSRVAILIVVVAGLAILKTESFWTADNINQVVFQQAPYTILMAFGMSLAIISKGIDISMASVMVLSSYLSARFFQQENYLMGILVAAGVGIGFGMSNGLLISKVRIEPYIATFSIDFIALGLAYVICNGNYIYGFPDGFRSLTNGSLLFGIPNIALITFIVFIFLYILTKKTTYGRGLYSIGYNKEAARLSGTKVNRIILSIYIFNGLLAALTGVLYLSRLNAADPSIKGSLTMDSIASALIGGIPFGGGRGSVVNTIVGALIIIFIRNGMNIMNISTNWQSAVIGMVILFSILYEIFLKKLMTGIGRKNDKNT